MIKFRYFIICTKIYHFSCHPIDRWRCILVEWKSFLYIDGVNKDFPMMLTWRCRQSFFMHWSTLAPAPSRHFFFHRHRSLPFVLLFANSKRIVWGMSGSNRTPCCNLLALYSTFYKDLNKFLELARCSSLKNPKHLILSTFMTCICENCNFVCTRKCISLLDPTLKLKHKKCIARA